MTDENKVYLDHLVERENLRYRRSEEQLNEYTQDKQTTLRLGDLTAQRGKYLRKPDFQRATWAWTPKECVSLLESIINYQVVPSIIMWSSPQNGYDYILDGGHRVSVVLAWLNDDWGEKHANSYIEDEEQINLIQAASREVRQLVRAKIGDISAYKDAEESLARVVRDRKSPGEVLDEITFQRGLFYQSLLKGDIAFHVLWVRGDFKIAEQSFLKINKSGRQLSDWETTLVENRNSSFARAVMSVASGNTAPHYWPEEAPKGPNQAELEQNIRYIHEGVRYLQTALFQPSYRSQIQTLQQPFMVSSIPDRPRYIAELLTITEGFRGQEPETQKLLKRNPDAEPEEIITDGWKLVSKAVDIFEHLNGPSNQPKSMAIVPALYFYNDAGRYVRSLLYGFIYWMFQGSDEDILNRKRLFSAYRGGFEQIIRTNKSEIVTAISRKTGSGPEVTVKTGRFYNSVLDLLIQFDGDIVSQSFADQYELLMAEYVTGDDPGSGSGRSRQVSRAFTDRQKSTAILARILDKQIACDICGGMLDPEGSIQHDHIAEYAQGGKTVPANQRIVHPFCNHQRSIIENYRSRSRQIMLPAFTENESATGVTQLVLIPDSAFR